jgi:integrase
MPRKRVTSVTLEALKPGREFTDETGMRIHVRKTKTTFLARYRRPEGQPDAGRGAKVVIGVFAPNLPNDVEPVLGGPMTLSGARAWHAKVRDMLARGIDPGRLKQETRRRRREAAELDQATLFPSVCREYVTKYSRARGHRKWRQQAGVMGLRADRQGNLLDEVTPGSMCDVWRNTPVGKLTLRDVQKLCDRYVVDGQPYAALSRWRVCRRVLVWAKRRGIIAASPLTDAEPPFRGAARDRVLEDYEVRALWHAAETQGVHGKLIQFLLLTGLRLNEARGMRRSEVAPDGVTFTVPASRMKGKREHVVYLSKAARDVLAGVPVIRLRDGTTSDLVFTLTGRVKIGGESVRKRKLDTAMKVQLEKLGKPWAAWRVHDLRRVLATNYQRMGIRFEVTEATLAHVGLSRGGVAGIYSRHDWAREKADAWERWAARLARIVEGQPVATDNVIPIRA